MNNYGFYTELNCSFESAAEIILPLIQKHNFSIVTQIDLKEKFADKLDIKFGQYTILGLCNPTLAHAAVTVEANIGLFFPCNMVIYEKEDKTAVAVMKPSEMMKMVDNRDFMDIALKVEKDLKTLFLEISDK